MQFKQWLLESSKLRPEISELVNSFKSWKPEGKNVSPGFKSLPTYDFMAVLAGIKPAALSSLQQLRSDRYFSDLDSILNAIISIPGYSVRNVKTLIGGQNATIIVAGKSKNVDDIVSAYQENQVSKYDTLNHTKIGLALGYSPDQVEKFSSDN